LKRFLSVFLVLAVLLSLSVTTFAAEAYTPKTVKLEYNPDTYTFYVPKGVNVYVGDTVILDYMKCNIVDSTEYVDYYLQIFPSDLVIKINDKTVGGFWYSSTIVFDSEKFLSSCSGYLNDYPGLSIETPGHVEIKVAKWHFDYKGGNDEFTKPEDIPLPVIAEFELKHPAARFGDNCVGFMGGVFSLISELVKTIVKFPLILVFVVMSLVGLGIGIFCRVKK